MTDLQQVSSLLYKHRVPYVGINIEFGVIIHDVAHNPVTFYLEDDLLPVKSAND